MWVLSLEEGLCCVDGEVERCKEGEAERWRDGEAARCKDEVERWRDGEAARCREGETERCKMGGDDWRDKFLVIFTLEGLGDGFIADVSDTRLAVLLFFISIGEEERIESLRKVSN